MSSLPDEAYLRAEGIPCLVDCCLQKLLQEKPANVVPFMINFLQTVPDTLIFQLGTNNWQSEEEFAPGSGILHQAHHEAYLQMPKTMCYSIFPSKRQSSTRKDVTVFKLTHDIPICESISPVSSYRWHSMSEQEFSAYRERLTTEVFDLMQKAEEQEGRLFTHAIAHHTFLNPLVMRDVIARRVAQGKPKIPLICFAHGTALKMYVHERDQKNPQDFPLRFLPMMEREKIFGDVDGAGVQLAFAISQQQIDALVDMFPTFPRDRVCSSPNGINPLVFYRDTSLKAGEVLSGFKTVPYEGSPKAPVQLPSSGYDHVVVFVGKMADWKRLDAVLHAAKRYERELNDRVLTVIVGGGPVEDYKKYQDLSDSLGLQKCFFLGPHGQEVLRKLYNVSSVGIFPSYKEPFGMVFIECMACGTPVIGANSGGPKDFVTPDVGTLVPEVDDRAALAESCASAVLESIRDNWKVTKGPACINLATEKYSVANQCTQMLADCKRILGV